MLGTGFEGESCGEDEALEVGALGECDGAGAGELAADLAIDECGGSGDWVKELDTSSLFHAEVPALDLAEDFPVAADDEVS